MIHPFPQIRLTLDSMRMSIINAIDTQYPDWLECLDQQLKDATSDKNFGRMLNEEITKAVHEKVKWMVQSAVSETFKDKEIKDYLVKKATEVFKRKLERENE